MLEVFNRKELVGSLWIKYMYVAVLLANNFHLIQVFSIFVHFTVYRICDKKREKFNRKLPRG